MEIDWITMIAGLGIGSIGTAFTQHMLKKKEAQNQSQHEILEERYKTVILLMYASINFKDKELIARIHRPDLKSERNFINVLQLEWHNMFLFASQNTLNYLSDFISNRNFENFKSTANAMREDLGRGALTRELNKIDI